MARLIPFCCDHHGCVETVPAADVTCRCGRKSKVPEEYQDERKKALDVRRKRRKRLGVS